jgi:type II restriction enzyme
VTYALFETVVVALGATVTVAVSDENLGLLREFSDLAKVLLGIDTFAPKRTDAAHIYRVGVTNAADRGLDMWANFGPAVQVKHLTLNPELAKHVVDQVESDHIVVVCRAAERDTIQIVTNQTSWGKRVRGIVTESDLNNWYERALRGEYSSALATPLLETLRNGFASEFPQSTELLEFFSNRGYDSIDDDPRWTFPPL